MDLTGHRYDEIGLLESGDRGGAPGPRDRDLVDLMKDGFARGRAQGFASEIFQEGEGDDLEGDVPPLPKTIMLIPAGVVVKARDGREFEVDRDEVVRAANANGADLFIDWDHAAFGWWLGGDGTGKTSPSAAWIDHTTIRKSGRGKNAAIVGDVSFWTPGGRESVQTREYRYISPAVTFLRDEDGRVVLTEKSRKPTVIQILNAALVNLPALRMPALASRSDDSIEQETRTMNQEAIALALGLPKDADETKIAEAFHTLKNERETAKSDLELATTELAALKAKHEEVFESLSTATAKKDELAETLKAERNAHATEKVELRLGMLSVRAIINPAMLEELKAEGAELCALGPKGAEIFDRKIAKLEKDGKPLVELSGLDQKDAPAADFKCRGLTKADVMKNAQGVGQDVLTYLKHNPDLKPLFAEGEGA